VLAFKQVNERNKHAEVITLFTEELITGNGYTYRDLDAIASGRWRLGLVPFSEFLPPMPCP
jgi:tRNA A37 threonylcarbamoyladenosine modification protein TsaB